MAKEAATKAAREALEAAAKASTAAEAAAAAEREVLDVAPIEIEHAPPPTTAATRRYVLLQNTWPGIPWKSREWSLDNI